MVSPWRKPTVPIREEWYVPVLERHRVPVAGAAAHEQDWAESQAVQGQRNLSAGKARQAQVGAIGAAPPKSATLGADKARQAPLGAIGAAPPKAGAPQ